MMTPQQLRDLQTPFKERYRAEPGSAFATLSATGIIDLEKIAVNIKRTEGASNVPGLHPMAGGDGTFACAAEMLLEALIGCAGVTFGAVCTAMEIPIDSARIVAEGDMDFRGTLGVDRDTPVGFTSVRLKFELASNADDAKLSKAVQLAERYCVVAQTLQHVDSTWVRVN